MDAFWPFYVDRLWKCSRVGQVDPRYHRLSTGATERQGIGWLNWAVGLRSFRAYSWRSHVG